MAALQFYLLGAPRLEQQQQNINLSRRKAIAALAYLAVTRQLHSRDKLATLLWPDQDQSGARANLRRDLSTLKQLLGDHTLHVDQSLVGLNPEADLWLDVGSFEAGLAAAQQHSHTNGHLCAECTAALKAAVDLYHGDFMAGFSLPDCPEFDEWQFFETERLRHLLAEALQRLIGWHTDRMEYEPAIAYARRWLALDALHEPAHRHLMQFYAWAGQHAAALRQYQECARLLEGELGVPPDAETTALYEAIRTKQFQPLTTESAAGPATAEPILRERYQTERLLEVGGYGEVYLGRDSVTGRAVVIKRLKSELVAQDPTFVTRFVREAEALRQLNHPNIVTILAAIEQAGEQRIVMEYVPGGTLRDLLDKEGPLSCERSLTIALELADALTRAHHLNIIHRDLKPDNVLLAADGTPRLTDFGMARLTRDDVRLTRPGMIVGSPAYLSPEALRGEELDPRSDIWSFGVLLYELLAGRPPFDGSQLMAVLSNILQAPTPDIMQARSDVPPPLASLLQRMLAKDREQRPASMRQVAAELEAIRAGRPLEHSTPAQAATPPKFTLARPTTPVGSAALRSNGQHDQQIRFCTAPDGVRIAYGQLGTGPLLVKAGNPLNHLEYDRQSPIWRHWWTRLAEHHTFIRYDERGCGLSDRNVADFSLDAWVGDLETVVDQFDRQRFALLGVSQGASVAIAYAVRHPERVSHLILFGGYARGRFNRNPTPEQLEEARTLIHLIRVGWGQDTAAFRQVFANLLMPDGTPEQISWFAELARVSASAENAALMEMAFFNVNVAHLAPHVRVPTLVLHARHDAMCPFEEGRHMASLIPGARFVPLESNNHILLETEPAWPQFLDEVTQFTRTELAPAKTISPAVEVKAAQTASAPQRELAQSIRFSQSADSARLAYATIGAGLPHAEEAEQSIGPLFVARERELDRLAGLLDRALAGHSEVVFIVGEAGQGKTALLGEFARRAQSAHAGVLVASGSCNAYSGVGDPYLPFRDVLDMLCGNVEAKWTAGTLTRDHARRLWATLPHTLNALIDEGSDLLEVFVSGPTLLRRAITLHETDSADRLRALMDNQRNAVTQRQQPQLFEQYANVLRRLAARQPLILLLDDVQWIDEASLHLLFHLGRRLAGSQVLIVGAYRPSDLAMRTPATRSDDHPQRLTLDEVITEFKRRFGNIQIDLTQLESVEEQRFVEAILDSEPNDLDDSFRAALFRLTHGHALFTIELLRSLQERGDLMQNDAGRWQAGATLTWDTLPARVEAVIAQRLQRLSSGLRDLLNVACVEGEDFTAEVISSVLQIDKRQTLQMLSGDLAQRQRLVRERDDIEIGRRQLARYQFSHALFQQYLYQSLSANEQRQLHHQVAHVLEALYEDQLDEIAVQLAHHFAQAADRDKAAHYLRRAGDRALRSAAFAEAVRHYQAALPQWAAADAIGQAELLRALGECWWALGDFPRAFEVFQEVYKRYLALDDRQSAGAAQRVMGRIYWEASDRAQSTQHYQQALAILEPLGDSVELAHVYSGLSSIYMLATELDEALAWGERALALAQRLGAEDVIVHALSDIGSSLYMRPEHGLALIQESLRRALAANLPHDVCRGYACISDTFRHLDRYAEAHDSLQAFVAYAERLHMGIYVHYAQAELFHVEWLRGDWSAWQRHQPQLAESLSGEVTPGIWTAFAGTFLGQAYNDLGQSAAARYVLELTLSQARGAAESQTTLPHLGELARAYAGLGRAAETTASVTEIIEWIERVKLTHPNSIMALHFACQWAAEQTLIDLARRGLRQLKRMLEIQPLPGTAASRCEVRGHVALAENDFHRAVESLSEALDKWTAQERPYDQLRTLNGLSRALIESGKHPAAREACDRAFNIVEQLAAQLDNEDLKTSFINSPLVCDIRERRMSL